MTGRNYLLSIGLMNIFSSLYSQDQKSGMDLFSYVRDYNGDVSSITDLYASHTFVDAAPLKEWSIKDVAGWIDTVTGKEYALICKSIDGLGIVDVSDPRQPKQILTFQFGNEDNSGTTSNIAQDVKVYNDLAVVSNQSPNAYFNGDGITAIQNDPFRDACVGVYILDLSTIKDIPSRNLGENYVIEVNSASSNSYGLLKSVIFLKDTKVPSNVFFPQNNPLTSTNFADMDLERVHNTFIDEYGIM